MVGDIGMTDGRAESRRVHAIVQAIEAAADVRRRYQFFAWTQGSFQTLLPHTLAICGAYERHRRQVRLEVFNSVRVPAFLLKTMTDGQSPLMQHVVGAWVSSRERPLIVRLNGLAGRPARTAADGLREAGFLEFLVHGVSRPERADEIETLFIFSSADSAFSEADASSLELLLPYLHSTYLRVRSVEREIAAPRASLPAASGSGRACAGISQREGQVLNWVREGMSNQSIGEKLGISPLTVKNHVQNILRKLGASNRAQAVARAISMDLLVLHPGESEAA